LDWNSLRETLITFYHHWQSLAYAIFVLLGTLFATAVIHLLLRKRHKRPGTSKRVWRDAVLGALNAPLQCVVWIIGLSVAEGALTAGGRMPFLAETFSPARDVVVIAIVAWFVIRLARRAVKNLYVRAKLLGKDFDETAADAIGKSSTAVILIVAALVAMQTLGFSITSLLAFGGVAGIALGFAAQGLVANLLGGITIYASRPFKVGDHIILPDASLMGNAQYIGWQAGEVQHIGWRATRILDWNGKPFYVPNAKFNTQTIINHSRMSFRQISENVYVRLEDIDKVPGIVADVNRMLEAHPEMGDYLIFRFDSYGQYALKLYLYAYTAGTVTAYTDYMRVKQDLLLRIAAIIAQHDAKLAVPVSTVYLPGEPVLRRGDEPHEVGPASAGMMERGGTKG
jgi:MscS family membrane protein